ncbi:MAG: glycosyl hydrolase family 8 [Brevinematales bacterium]
MERIGRRILSLFFVVIIAGCAFVPQEKVSDVENNFGNGNVAYEKAVDSIIKPNMPYRFGNQFVPNRLPMQQLIHEYNEWKRQYVVDAGNGMLRVRRDAGTDYDTVSEGIAYGMLLAVYFNDRNTLDGLYKYAKAHFHGKGLMHWKVDKNGVDISEFNIPVPHGYVWKNTNTGQQIATNITDKSEMPGTGWVRVTWYTRGKTSATDADLDMAMALVMAYKLWGSSQNYNYQTEARTLLSNIMNYDMGVEFGNELFVYPGACVNGGWSGIWGGPKGWNPSYFTPAWFKVFRRFTGDTNWDILAIKMYQHIDKIHAVNKGTGILPDWCDTSGSLAKSVYGAYNVSSDTYTGVSDILVFLVERTNSNGQIITNYYSSPRGNMSFNLYYDAIRVMWRMAVAVSWFGDEKAKKIILLQNQFFRNKYYQSPEGINNIKDGYFVDGTAWKPLSKDALSVSKGGQWTTSPFVSMIATSALFADNDYATKLYNALVNCKTPYTDTYHYYGNTLRLLALLYLSGEFPNIYQPITNKIPSQIEAEDFISMSNAKISSDWSPGITAVNGDYMGGSYWVEYYIDVPQTRSYTLIYRVSSPSYPQHKLSFATNGITISTLDVPESEWTTIQTTITLSAGKYPVRIYSTGGRYSFDWFELK